MTVYGLKKVEIAKLNGTWTILDSIDIRIETPDDLKKALESHPDAKLKFEKLPPSRKKQFLWWIKSAKRSATRTQRIDKVIQILLESKSP